MLDNALLAARGNIMGISPTAERYRQRYFRDEDHPYRLFESLVATRIQPDGVLLDVGCGRTAPVLSRFAGRARRLVGIDLVPFDAEIPGIELYNRDISATGLASGSIDVVMARSVMEHVTEPQLAFAELGRILAPGGSLIFLTANLWDYASLVAMAVPNRWHPWIVERVEGRAPEDVFPVAYRCNTKMSIQRFAKRAGLEVRRIEYLGQYPAYFMFNGPLFLLATAYEKLLQRVPALGFFRGWILSELTKPRCRGSA
jgi:SAM-dependent methyltransferase